MQSAISNDVCGTISLHILLSLTSPLLRLALYRPLAKPRLFHGLRTGLMCKYYVTARGMETTNVIWFKWTVIDLNECDSKLISCWIYETKSSQLVDRDSMCVLVELFHGMNANLRLTDQDFHVKMLLIKAERAYQQLSAKGMCILITYTSYTFGPFWHNTSIIITFPVNFASHLNHMGRKNRSTIPTIFICQDRISVLWHLDSSNKIYIKNIRIYLSDKGFLWYSHKLNKDVTYNSTHFRYYSTRNDYYNGGNIFRLKVAMVVT